MARTKKVAGAGNTALVIVLTLVVAVVVNILGNQLYGRVDLTEYGVNLLSDASKDAVRDLDGLEIRVFISDPLPDEIPSPAPGRPPLTTLGLGQKLKDKIEEYKAVAGAGVTVTYVADNVVEEGKKARLKPFKGKGGTFTEAGGIKRDEYVLGVTFNYKNAMEVYDLALYPEVYEFEITKRLLRLKDKAEHALTMKDLLRSGEAVNDAVTRCVAALEAAAPDQDAPSGAMMLLNPEDTKAKVAAYTGRKDELTQTCGAIAGAVEQARTMKGKSEQLDRVALVADAFAQNLDQFWTQLGGSDPQAATSAAVNGIKRVLAIGHAIENEYQDLVDSPGRRRIGFVCDGKTFCPFPDAKPLVPKEIEGALTQKNPILQQMLPAMQQMQQQIANLLAQINQGLFRARGFDIVQIDLDDDIPDDVQALVVFGPKGSFTDYQLYQLDQFVVGGGSLVVFLNPWDVQIQGYTARGEPQLDPKAWKLTQNTSNITDLLATWGITPSGALVLEPKKHGDIALMTYLQTNQGYVPFQAQEFPYPMVPTLDDLDRSDPLVRATNTITLPFATTLTLKAPAGGTLTALARTSADALTTTDTSLPLEPGAQFPTKEALEKKMIAKAADPLGTPDAAKLDKVAAPAAVIAVASGTLPSHFAGKDAPKAPEKKPDPLEPEPKQEDAAVTEALGAQHAKRDSGAGGRVLVIGSNLGLEPLSKDVIFAGFDLAAISGDSFDFIEQFRQYQANFQNWSNQVQQIQHTLGENLQFLSNALDWSIQRDALVELRAKQIVARPLSTTADGDHGGLQAAAVLVAPLLFLLAGLAYVLRRRSRQRRLSL
ncbi:MAG: hypothetical protein EP329_10695 [Deltaproteobacteria bacterium]|nr:MAG: hypothetical protein EP329_10695 [Deltaproteobacteria bacterium]